MKNQQSSPAFINRTRLILLVVIPALLPLGAMAFFAWIPTPLLKYFFFTKGWMAWTLTEYAIHRWSFHHKQDKGNRERDLFNHTYHHTHPADMIITPLMRSLALVALGLSAWSLLQGPVLLTYFTGWLSGLALYSIMHYFLHQSIAVKIFPTLVKQHIWHHTKYADKCFGVSTIFWDRAFKTLPKEFKQLPVNAIRFYYKHESMEQNKIERIVHKLYTPSQLLANTAS
jgi:sterol desaturase/sphingolipid hydroxylase (fatty acid hydroxylase superfamily)